ncbi:hypothetical protein [Mesorhizobium onobrychidis]|uniref:Uncharacterized protein n=1 Tax=Mesorhizobium onobrychidis TaxID=2775404 RepID=A0ABY5QUM4_9HYPH|nr:hypothetical protein [Mesorhizobium onobrychidis]UVC14758.1 hypothetical protein IHQ72_29780 [Mesorhizobium onobrychidis]
MTGDTSPSDRCAKPGCGALKRIGNPCTDWDCPQKYVTAADYRTLQDHIAALEAEIAQLRDGSIKFAITNATLSARCAELEARALKAEADHETLSGIICDLFQEDKHYDGCLFKENRNFPCQCGYNDRMAKYQAAVRAAKEHAAARSLAWRAE